MTRFWKVGVLVAALLALVGVAAGIVAAQTGGGTSTPTEQSATATKDNSTATAGSSTPSSSTPSAATPGKKQQLRDDFLNKLAANLGISVDQLKQALTTTDQQMLDQAVADGKITQAEADKIKAKIASGDVPFFPFMGRHGRGPGFGRGLGGDLVKQTADFLGIDRQTVMDALKNNETLAQIAQDHGKTADELSGYVYDQLKSNLDQAVQNNKVTQDREDNILSNAKDRINSAINNAGFGKWGGGDKEMPDNGSPSDNSSTTSPSSL
jgi:LysM repeat protein